MTSPGPSSGHSLPSPSPSPWCCTVEQIKGSFCLSTDFNLHLHNLLPVGLQFVVQCPPLLLPLLHMGPTAPTGTGPVRWRGKGRDLEVLGDQSSLHLYILPLQVGSDHRVGHTAPAGGNKQTWHLLCTRRRAGGLAHIHPLTVTEFTQG